MSDLFMDHTFIPGFLTERFALVCQIILIDYVGTVFGGGQLASIHITGSEHSYSLTLLSNKTLGKV